MIFGRMEPTELKVHINGNFKIGSGNLSQIVWLTTIERLEAGYH